MSEYSHGKELRSMAGDILLGHAMFYVLGFVVICPLCCIAQYAAQLLAMR